MQLRLYKTTGNSYRLSINPADTNEMQLNNCDFIYFYKNEHGLFFRIAYRNTEYHVPKTTMRSKVTVGPNGDASISSVEIGKFLCKELFISDISLTEVAMLNLVPRNSVDTYFVVFDSIRNKKKRRIKHEQPVSSATGKPLTLLEEIKEAGITEEDLKEPIRTGVPLDFVSYGNGQHVLFTNQSETVAGQQRVIDKDNLLNLLDWCKNEIDFSKQKLEGLLPTQDNIQWVLNDVMRILNTYRETLNKL
jgi:hypothetical protein